jgi:pyruvate dehydrogenase E2 component (dihydrolipoamide acetyltransferase)
MKKEIVIPDIAENVKTGIIASVLVTAGDKIHVDEPVVEIETDKATTEIPSPFDGTVETINVKAGDEVAVNQPIMIIETEKDKEFSGKENKTDGEKTKEKKVVDDSENIKKIDTEPDGTEPSGAEKPETQAKPMEKQSPGAQAYSDIPAAPSVRRIARELETDISKVKGTGPGNRITEEDVRNYSQQKQSPGGVEEPVSSQASFTEPMTNIRKITAKNMLISWQNIPQVTQYDESDITEMEEFRKKIQQSVEKSGGKLTITAMLVRICALALQRFPKFNSSLDMDKFEISYKNYFNIGVAVDTSNGLIVPVIKDAGKKTLAEISAELTELSGKARDKKISPEDLAGGTFTISNLGGIGGTAFSPIVYAPQVAILGVSRVKKQQMPDENDNFRVRSVLPLSLSYDHRVIDGAEGARFLRWICEFAENPWTIIK